MHFCSFGIFAFFLMQKLNYCLRKSAHFNVKPNFWKASFLKHKKHCFTFKDLLFRLTSLATIFLLHNYTCAESWIKDDPFIFYTCLLFAIVIYSFIYCQVNFFDNYSVKTISNCEICKLLKFFTIKYFSLCEFISIRPLIVISWM